MAAEDVPVLFAIISQPEHRQHEVDVVYIAVGQNAHQHNRCQRRHPEATQQLEADISYQVTEKDGLEKPHRIDESELAEIHHFRIGVVARKLDKGIHDKKCGDGRDDQLDEFLPEQLAEREPERRTEKIAAHQHEERHVIGVDKAPEGVVPEVIAGDLFYGVAEEYARDGEELQEIQVRDALLLYVHNANITVLNEKHSWKVYSYSRISRFLVW